MHSSPRHGRTAFSLIELMTVIAIIVILAGLIVGGLGFANERQAKEKCKVQIALLSKGIEAYKLDMGTYPGIDPNTIVSGDVSEQLYQALFKDGYDYILNPTGTSTKATKIYTPELDPKTSKQGWVAVSPPTAAMPVSLKIVDPWGHNYLYRKGTNAQNPDFDLWSMGKDGLTNTMTPADPKNRDDVKNF